MSRQFNNLVSHDYVLEEFFNSILKRRRFHHLVCFTRPKRLLRKLRLRTECPILHVYESRVWSQIWILHKKSQRKEFLILDNFGWDRTMKNFLPTGPSLQTTNRDSVSYEVGGILVYPSSSYRKSITTYDTSLFRLC